MKKEYWWPISITGFLLFIIAFNICFAVLASRTSNGELEAKPYEKGLVYEKEIQAETAANQLQIKPIFSKDELSKQVNFFFEGAKAPQDFAIDAITFWKPSDLKQDFSGQPSCNKTDCKISFSNELTGLWYYKISGAANQKDFVFKGTQVF